MKIKFNMSISAEDSIWEKIVQSLNNNENLHLDLIKCFLQVITLGFNLKQSDQVVVESFKVEKIEEQDGLSK